MNQETKEKIMKLKNMSEEELDKRIATNKKVMKFVLLPIVVMILLLSLVLLIPKNHPSEDLTNQKNKTENAANPLGLESDKINSLIGNDIMKEEEWNKWGEGVNTNHPSTKYWINYISSANLALVINNTNQKVIFASLGQEAASAYIEEITTQNTTLVESQFNPWNGEHINMTKTIKSSMNDPSSYKHIKTEYWDMGTHLVVQTEFTGKNGFGGTVRSTAKAKVNSKTGEVIDISEEKY